MIKFNKRGMMDDLFDFLFTIVMAVFFFTFLNYQLNAGIELSNANSLDKAADFQRQESAVNNLRRQIQHGEPVEPDKVGELIAQSKVLGGRTITNCRDYWNKEDCNQDVVGLHKNSPDKCLWEEESRQCIYFVPVAVRR